MCKGPEAGAHLASIFFFFLDHLLEVSHALFFFTFLPTSLASPGIYIILLF